jgi:hypothetical protein
LLAVRAVIRHRGLRVFIAEHPDGGIIHLPEEALLLGAGACLSADPNPPEIALFDPDRLVAVVEAVDRLRAKRSPDQK